MNEKIKNYLGIAGVFALVIITLTSLNFANTYSKSVEPGSFRSFTSHGEGKVVLVPDIAQFSASIVTEGGMDIGALQKENTQKGNAIIAFLKENNIDEKDIKTSNYSVSPRYKHFDCYPRSYEPMMDLRAPQECPPSEIVGYSIYQNIEVKIRDFTTAGDILSGVVNQGANSVSGLWFTVDDIEKAKTEARTIAIERAKEQAYATAKAGGFRVGKLLSLDEGFNSNPPYRTLNASYDMAGSASVKEESVAFEPGSQDIVVQVTLRYEIQ